jgi:NitT/TauT family transport system substrate-binding protein
MKLKVLFPVFLFFSISFALPIRFITHWYPEVEHGGFYTALVNHYYKSINLDLTIIKGGPGINNIYLTLNGYGDITLGNSFDVLRIIKEDLPLVPVGSFFQKSPQVLMTHPSTSVDFKSGKRFDFTSKPFGEKTWVALLKDKLPINKITYTKYLYSLLNHHEVMAEGYITSEPYVLKRAWGYEPKIILLDDLGYDLYDNIILVNKNFYDKHQKQVKDFLEASLRGWKEFEKNPEPAMKAILKENSEMTKDRILYGLNALKSYSIINPTYKMMPSRWNHFYDLCEKSGAYTYLDPKKRYLGTTP